MGTKMQLFDPKEEFTSTDSYYDLDQQKTLLKDQ